MNDQPSGKAVAAFVFGVLSFAGLPCIGALAAIVLGWGEKSSLGRAGWILGWVNVCVMLFFMSLALFVLFLIAVSNHH